MQHQEARDLARALRELFDVDGAWATWLQGTDEWAVDLMVRGQHQQIRVGLRERPEDHQVKWVRLNDLVDLLSFFRIGGPATVGDLGLQEKWGEVHLCQILGAMEQRKLLEPCGDKYRITPFGRRVLDRAMSR